MHVSSVALLREDVADRARVDAAAVALELAR